MPYQDLNGAAGRRIYFRARRHRASALLGRGASTVRVRLGSHEGRLIDISLNGLACQIQSQSTDLTLPGVHEVLPAELWVRDECAFTGLGEIVRVDADTALVGVRLIDALVEPESLKRVYRGLEFREELQRGTEIYDSTPRPYRDAIQDVATVLLHWRKLLDQREGEIRAFQGSSEEVRELEQVAEKRLRSDWLAAHSRANREADRLLCERPAAVRSAKRLTETLVTPILACAPIWRHAYEKPRGFPGDFELMNYMYDETPEGSSIFARIMHQLGREERLAATVRNRRDLLARQIGDVVCSALSAGDAPARITNIGSGPARELEDLAQSSLSAHVLVHLIDQDEAALAYAHGALSRAYLGSRTSIDIQCRHVSFGQLIKERSLLGEISEQHLIYSAGLLDYLPMPVASALVAHLVSLLRTGGTLVVGNAAVDDGIRWVPDFVLDWPMIYRTRAEMLDLVKDVRGLASVGVEVDDSGAWNFLVLRKT